MRVDGGGALGNERIADIRDRGSGRRFSSASADGIDGGEAVSWRSRIGPRRGRRRVGGVVVGAGGVAAAAGVARRHGAV